MYFSTTNDIAHTLGIPFKLKKEDALAALKKHYEGRPFLPDAFIEEGHIEEIKGITDRYIYDFTELL